jgi:hypothetical protein
MRGTFHLVAILLMALGAGCASTVDVMVDEREDLSRYRTWDWSPRGRAKIDAPGGDAPSLDMRLMRLIERKLLENGFRHARDRSDFFVSYRLALRRRAVVVSQPRAAHQLSSHHDSGSFVIEGSERVTRVYERIHLSFHVTEAGGRTLWQAQLTQQEEEIFAMDLDEAVALLLERLPRHRPGPDPREPPPESESLARTESARRRVPERYRDADQWCVLLRPVDVRVADAPGVGGPLDGDLDSESRVEEDHVVDVLGWDLVQPGDEVPVDHARLLHDAILLLVVEQDVERQLEGTGVLAAQHLGQIVESCFARHS